MKKKLIELVCVDLFIFFMMVIPSIVLKDNTKDIYNLISILVIVPLVLFVSCFYYSFKEKINLHLPIVLTILFVPILYLGGNHKLTALNIFLAMLYCYLANIVVAIIKNKRRISIKGLTIKDKYKLPLSLSLFLLAMVILEVFYRMCTFGSLMLNINMGVVFMSLILFSLLYLLFFSILGSTFRTNVTLILIMLVLFFVNQMRIFYTSDTLLLTDVLFLQNAGEIGGFIDVTFVSAINSLFLPTVIMVIIFSWIGYVSYYSNVKNKRRSLRIPMLVLAIMFLAFLFAPIKKVNRFILDIMYDYSNQKDYVLSVSNTRYYYRYGVISGMYGKFLESRIYEPDGYDEQKITSIVEKAERIDATWGNPNIIVVFSESFWDIDKLDSIKFKEDVIPNFRKLKSEGKFFDMISPAYGGVSANVEWQVLTGGSLNYFSKGYIPYMQLYNNDKSSKYPNIIRELNNNGYKTKIINSSSGGMFDCANVYKKWELSGTRHLKDELDLKGAYVTDNYLTSMAINEFNNKSSDEKLFYMMITMGGHMPYYYERYDNYDVAISKSEYSDDVNGTILAYAQGIHNADKELGSLYDYINTLDEDTIIVFFGDHLPLLQTKKGKDALYETGYLNRSYTPESLYRQFNTQALILSNYDIKHADLNYISPDLLLTYVINNLNIDVSDYYKYLYSTIYEMPSSNYVISIDSLGYKYYTKEGNQTDVYDLRKQVQYKYFH